MALQDALKGADWNPNVAIDRLRATIRQQRKPKAKVNRRPAPRVEMSDDESEGQSWKYRDKIKLSLNCQPTTTCIIRMQTRTMRSSHAPPYKVLLGFSLKCQLGPKMVIWGICRIRLESYEIFDISPTLFTIPSFFPL